MRVGIITDAFPPEVGGVQTFADQFVTRLAEASEIDHVEVIAFVDGADEHGASLTVRRVGSASTPRELLTGLRWCRRHSFDVVHALTLYPGGLIAALCGRLSSSTTTFATVYGLDAISLADHVILGPVHRFMFDSFDEVLFFSDSTREKTHDAYGMEFPSRRLYPGAPSFERSDRDPLESMDLSPGEFVVLTVARLVERKGIEDLVAAVGSLPNVSLWVAGDGPRRSHLEAAVPDTARDRIHFFGEVPHDQLPYLYERADLFSMPSVYLEEEGDIEGLGLVFLEAQQFGLPVIGTRSGGVPEAFDDGRTGFLVDERSPDQIKRRIVELRDDPDRYQQFSTAARSFVEEQFGWDDCIANHIEAYQS